eukprot:4333745-Alexandrium_andersonii.AAC.1
MDRVKHGPICKHAGAVLYALAAEQREKTEQFPAPSAADWILSPELRAELMARNASDGRGFEPSALRAAGSAQSKSDAAKVSQLKEKA